MRGKAPLFLAVAIGVSSGRLRLRPCEHILTVAGYYIWQPYFEEKESLKFKQQQYVFCGDGSEHVVIES